MASQTREYPIVDKAINLFGSWLKHRQKIRELRGINSGDLARSIADLCVTPADLNILVRKGPHASDALAEAF